MLLKNFAGDPKDPEKITREIWKFDPKALRVRNKGKRAKRKVKSLINVRLVSDAFQSFFIVFFRRIGLPNRINQDILFSPHI